MVSSWLSKFPVFLIFGWRFRVVVLRREALFFRKSIVTIICISHMRQSLYPAGDSWRSLALFGLSRTFPSDTVAQLNFIRKRRFTLILFIHPRLNAFNCLLPSPSSTSTTRYYSPSPFWLIRQMLKMLKNQELDLFEIFC